MNENDPGVEPEASDDEPSRVPTIRVPRNGVLRLAASSMDQVLMLAAMVVIAKQIHTRPDLWQWATIVGTYVGYFFVFEALFAATPGKFFTGLVVVDYDGRRCTWRQAWTRSWMRLLELNPLLLGELPAALKIVSTPYHQRYGDILARTLVVPRSSVVRR